MASFCSSHLVPRWTGSNFQAGPHCCSLMRECQHRARHTVGSGWPSKVPHRPISSQGWPTQNPLMCWEACGGREELTSPARVFSGLEKSHHSTPFQPYPASLPPSASPLGQAPGALGGGQDLDSFSASPFSSSEASATFLTLHVFIYKTVNVNPSMVEGNK